jgi:hypothetical protein
MKPERPFSRYLLDRLRERPEAEQIVLMRQVELLKSGTRTSMHPAGVGQAGALELLMKLGSFLNES